MIAITYNHGDLGFSQLSQEVELLENTLPFANGRIGYWVGISWICP